MRQRHAPVQTITSAAANGLMLFLGLTGAFFSFFSSFPPMPADAGILFPACLVVGLGALLIFSIPWHWCRLGLILVWFIGVGWMVWTNFDPLIYGSLTIAEQVGGVFAQAIGMGLVAPDFSHIIGSLSPSELQAAGTLLCLVFLALFAPWLGWVVVRRHSFWLAFWSTFPLLLAPLTITVTPDWRPLAALLLFWTVGALTRLIGRRDAWGHAKLTLFTLPTAALFLFLLGLFLPQNAYDSAQWIPTVRMEALSRLSSMGKDLILASGFQGSLSGLAGDSVEVDLSQAGPLRYTGNTVLRVESEVTGHIYLRGFSAGLYTSKGWEQLSETDYEKMRNGWTTEFFPMEWEDDWAQLGRLELLPTSGRLRYSFPGIGTAQPLNFPALADLSHNPSAPSRRFTIESVGSPTGYVYTPYQLSTSPERMTGAMFVNDAYLARSTGIWRYVLYAQAEATPFGGTRLTGTSAEVENAYRAFVQQHYLQLPDDAELQEALFAVLGDSNFERNYSPSAGELRFGPEQLTPVEVAQAVADLLAERAVYDLETPFTPEGEDFVSYFLTTSKRGYCMHFASAATLMLRALGIPARYVTGYTAEAKANQTVNVPDRNAHAWVEVYVDGYGWQNVEVTPGFSDEAPPLQNPGSMAPTVAPSSTVSPGHTASPKPTQTPNQPEYDQEDTPFIGIQSFALIWLILPAALLLGSWFLHLYARSTANRRRKRFYQDDVNGAVIAMYQYSQQLLRYHKHKTLPCEPEALGQKARFSRHTLTEAERLAMLAYTTRLSLCTYAHLTIGHKFFFRYIKGL